MKYAIAPVCSCCGLVQSHAAPGDTCEVCLGTVALPEPAELTAESRYDAAYFEEMEDALHMHTVAA